MEINITFVFIIGRRVYPIEIKLQIRHNVMQAVVFWVMVAKRNSLAKPYLVSVVYVLALDL